MTDSLVGVEMTATEQLGSPRLLAIAQQALAAAEGVREVRLLVDQSGAMRGLVRAARKGREAQNEWAEFRLDAQRKGGAMLRQMDEDGERSKGGRPRNADHADGSFDGRGLPTLVDLGVADEPTTAQTRATRWQQLALIPDEPWAQWKAQQRSDDKDITEAAALAFAKRFQEWTERERDLFKHLLEGETVILSFRTDEHLIEWADEEALFVRIDRRSDWGNPFLMDDGSAPGDGDRATVIAHYEAHYLPFKPSLLGRLADLRGKALGCWCAPEACHGDVLKRWAQGDSQ